MGEWERGREGERKTPGGRDCEGLVGMEKESDLLCCRSDQKGSDQRRSDERGGDESEGVRSEGVWSVGA